MTDRAKKLEALYAARGESVTIIEIGWGRYEATKARSKQTITERELLAEIARLEAAAETALLHWYRIEFERRTLEIGAGTARIDWLDAGTRVSWTEIVAKAEALGISRNPVDLRNWIDSVRGNQ